MPETKIKYNPNNAFGNIALITKIKEAEREFNRKQLISACTECDLYGHKEVECDQCDGRGVYDVTCEHEGVVCN